LRASASGTSGASSSRAMLPAAPVASRAAGCCAGATLPVPRDGAAARSDRVPPAK
jgi:hypothetical protein